MKLDNSLLYNIIDPVDFEEHTDLLTLALEMVGFMEAHGGIGLAANQVGINKRILIFRTNLGDNQPCFNPKVLDFSDNCITLVEGCLSFPELQKAVTRPNWVDAEWQDNFGTIHRSRLTGLEARIYQHEVDHLNGITINER